MQDASVAPLSGLRAIVHASGVAAAYAGRMLGVLGAEVILAEPPGGTPLRREPPFLPGSDKAGALFAYLAAGMRSMVCDMDSADGRAAMLALLSQESFTMRKPLAEMSGLAATVVRRKLSWVRPV